MTDKELKLRKRLERTLKDFLSEDLPMSYLASIIVNLFMYEQRRALVEEIFEQGEMK